MNLLEALSVFRFVGAWIRICAWVRKKKIRSPLCVPGRVGTIIFRSSIKVPRVISTPLS